MTRPALPSQRLKRPSELSGSDGATSPRVADWPAARNDLSELASPSAVPDRTDAALRVLVRLLARQAAAEHAAVARLTDPSSHDQEAKPDVG